MFCFQCEQTAGGKGCTKAGVCGKNADVAGLQDQLTGALVGLARATDGNTLPSENTYKLLIKGLFTTITNVNFNELTLKALIDEVHAEKESLVPNCNSCDASCGRNDDYDMNLVWDADEDIRSLKSLILFGIRGMAAYAYHAGVLGYYDERVNKFIAKALFAIGQDWGMDQLLPIVLEVGEVNFACMEMLDKANTETYGNPVPATVPLMVEKGPFCNSDKYSFIFIFQQVLNQIPKNMRGMLERGEVTMNEMALEELETAAYIRRSYLQDLYRFFRLFPQRAEFVNPFDIKEARYLFCANTIFSKTHFEPFFNEIAAFLIKQKRMAEVAKLLENYGESRRDFQFWMMAGYLAQHAVNVLQLDEDDLLCYTNALALQPDNERALAGYARALFSRHMYQEALEAYDKLLVICPDKKSYRLNRAVSLTNIGQYGEALKDLYRLNYESPDDQNVNRVLAWTLVCEGKYEAADKIYVQLLSGEVHPDDLLNYGYALWFSGNIDEAADCFHRFLKETGRDARCILENEADLLREKGISEPEQQMMLYIL